MCTSASYPANLKLSLSKPLQRELNHLQKDFKTEDNEALTGRSVKATPDEKKDN